MHNNVLVRARERSINLFMCVRICMLMMKTTLTISNDDDLGQMRENRVTERVVFILRKFPSYSIIIIIIMRPQKRNIIVSWKSRVCSSIKARENSQRGSEREIKERENVSGNGRGFFTYNCEGDSSLLQSFILPQTDQFSEVKKGEKNSKLLFSGRSHIDLIYSEFFSRYHFTRYAWKACRYGLINYREWKGCSEQLRTQENSLCSES